MMVWQEFVFACGA